MTDLSQFKLIIEDDEGRRSVVPVELGDVSIGRVEGNTIRLKERNVSRHHARLRRENGNIFAEDLDSFNGLWVNGDRITGRHEMHDGDLLRIGDFHLELHGEGLHPRREDTTQRTVLGDPDTSPGFNRGHAGTDEPTVTGAKLVHNTEPTQIIEPNAGVPDASEDAYHLPSGSRDEERRPAAGAVASARAKLLCVSTQFAGREYEITKPEVVIGRTEDNDIGIDHRSVSRQHAKITLVQRRYKIFDLQSANGTLVNGEAYAQTELKSGDLIELGHVRFRFVPSGETYALTAEEQAMVDGAGQSPTWGGRNPVLLFGAAGLTSALLVIAAWLALGGNSTDKNAATGDMPALVAPKLESSESDRLMAQARVALGQRQWKRGQALGNAVLALDPGNSDALNALRQIDVELRAQHSYETAGTAAAAGQWSDAWNALQEVPKESVFYGQATALTGQVRPALVNERLNECRAALKTEDWDEAETQLEEVDGLEAGRKDVAELRASIDDGRKRRGGSEGKRSKGGHSKSKDTAKILKPAAPPAAPAAPLPPRAPPADDPQKLNSEGIKAYSSNNFAKAVDEFTRCISADKTFAPCYRNLGVVYAKSGNGPKAAKYYRFYLKLDPNAKDAETVRKYLQQFEASSNPPP